MCRSKERSRKKKKKSKSVEEREGVKGAVRERKEGDDEPLCDSQDSQKTEVGCGGREGGREGGWEGGR